jgi:hypothetical protein
VLPQQIVIRPVGEHPTVHFAAVELAGILRRVLGEGVPVAIEPAAVYQPSKAGALWLGVGEQVGLGEACLVRDPVWDDAVAIAVRAGQGRIAGSNPRSVLLAVYRFLTTIGCRWVRPGAEGELIPRRVLTDLCADLREKAAYRHRGTCIEGAVSDENVIETIAWAPKVGFNAYFTQFREAYTFYERWYTHRNNPLKTPEPFSVERAQGYLAHAVKELKRRDLLYHAVGHGWTCEPFGIPGLSWDKQTYTVPESTLPYLAEVNGERALWQGIPLNTNLCYSNPEVRRIITTSIADYAAAHPAVDALHFWLADGSNNHCECARCRQRIPADWYVQMLNEVDALLTQRGLPTRIVFLIYFDLLWPPQAERLNHPERFILMFAPITRTYSKDFAVQGEVGPLPPYQRNRLTFPKNVDENVAFLRAWQQFFSGDSFDFDYHLMWDHYTDPSNMASARLLSRDAKLLEKIGLDGFMSCQVQRATFPTALSMTVLGRTLWDDQLTFEEIAADYFASAYGADGALVQGYLEQLGALFDPPYLRGEEPVVNEAAAQRFARIPRVVREFAPILSRNLAAPGDECHAVSWRYLARHADFCMGLAQVLEARARGDEERVSSRWAELVANLQKWEDTLQPALDVFECIATLERRLRH